MDIFSDDKEDNKKEDKKSEENKSFEAELPEVKPEDDSQEYYYHFHKSLKSTSKGDDSKATVTQKTDNNGSVKTISEEFSDLSEAKRYFDGLSHDEHHEHNHEHHEHGHDEHHDHEMMPMNIPVIELDGVEISSKTKPFNDLLVFADHLDKLGHEELADKLFIVAEKLQSLFKK